MSKGSSSVRLFKFRAASHLEFAFDIIAKKRLFCSDWRALNDPREGVFAYTYSGNEHAMHRGLLDQIVTEKTHLKVCSLSGTVANPLLWAHYAEGFKGIAIEVELPINPKILYPVRYIDEPYTVEGDTRSSHAIAVDALTRKMPFWRYESEIRILWKSNYFSLESDAIKAVHGGIAIDSSIEDVVSTYCSKIGVHYFKSKISGNRIVSGLTGTSKTDQVDTIVIAALGT